MVSPVDIANQALAAIGSQATISALNEGSTESNAVSTLYEAKRLAVMRAVHWDFARAQTTLSLLKAAPTTPENPTNQPPFPPQPWCYEYAYPPDCLKGRAILPLWPTVTTNPPITTGISQASPLTIGAFAVPFEVGSDYDTGAPTGNLIKCILTNQETAQLVYTRNIEDPDLWDPAFSDAFAMTLGAFLVNPLARNRALLQDCAKLAADAVSAARAVNGNEGPRSADHTPDWIRIRGVGANPAGWSCWTPWDALVLPGGFRV